MSPVPGDYFKLTLECRKTPLCFDAWFFDWVVLVYSDETRWFCFNKEKIWLSTDRKFPVVRMYVLTYGSVTFQLSVKSFTDP